MVTTDVASIMKKFEREWPFVIQHLCLNQEIWLAIRDFLYKDLSDVVNDEYIKKEEENKDELSASTVTTVMKMQDDFKTVLDNICKIIKLFQKKGLTKIAYYPIMLKMNVDETVFHQCLNNMN